MDSVNGAIASANGATPGLVSGANDAANQAQTVLANGQSTGSDQLQSGLTTAQQQLTAAQTAASGGAATLQQQLTSAQIPSIPAIPSSLLDFFDVFGSKQEQDILDA